MAINCTAVRAGLKAALNGLGMQVATAPDQITPPCLLLGMPSLDYHESNSNAVDTADWPVWHILPRASDQAAVDGIDARTSNIAGGSSVIRAIEADRTLAGACATLVVHTATPELYPGTTGDLPATRYEIKIWG